MRREPLTKLLSAVALVSVVFGASACDDKKPAGGDEKVAKADEGQAPAEAGEQQPEADGGEADAGGKAEDMPDPSTPEGKVALAAKVAGAIANEPASADEILAENGLDREKLDELMYEIATDPAMREEYAVAFAEARATG